MRDRHDEALMDKMCNHVTPEGMTRVLKLDAMSAVGFIETFQQEYATPPRDAFDFLMSLQGTDLWETYMGIDQFLTTEGKRIANMFPTETFRHMLEVFADDLCQ
jgi:hypothetical protein